MPNLVLRLPKQGRPGLQVKALFNFSVKILRPGPVNSMGAGGGAAAGGCLRAACTAFLKGWGLK